MKTLTKILAAALLFTSISSAFADTQDRHLAGFHAISLSASYNIYITQGASESVKVEAPAELMKQIITEVNGDVLNIHSKNQGFSWHWFSNSKKINIYITVSDVHRISVSGSGDVYFKEGLHADHLELSVTGSGDVLGKVDVKTLQSSVTGSGDIKLSGNADSSTASVAGSGDFMARDLVTNTTMIKVSGSGDAQVTANVKLDARVSGSGDIRYSGNAKQVSTSSSGSGDITHGR